MIILIIRISMYLMCTWFVYLGIRTKRYEFAAVQFMLSQLIFLALSKTT